MDTPAERPLSGADFIRQFFPTSPYVAHLGMQLTSLEGCRLVYLDVEVRSATGRAVARGLVTYKLG